MLSIVSDTLHDSVVRLMLVNGILHVSIVRLMRYVQCFSILNTLSACCGTPQTYARIYWDIFTVIVLKLDDARNVQKYELVSE